MMEFVILGGSLAIAWIAGVPGWILVLFFFLSLIITCDKRHG